MQRPIEFRAWDRKNRLIRPIESIDFDTLGVWFNDSGQHPDINSWTEDTNEYELMQYTGLKDKNGVDVAQEDIVKDHYAGIGIVKLGEYSIMGEVREYKTVGFYIEWKDGSVSPFEIYGLEVIGNIYTTPKLVKGAA